MHDRLKPGFEADLILLWDGERCGPFSLITCQRACNHTATAKVITEVVPTPPPWTELQPFKICITGKSWTCALHSETDTVQPVALESNIHTVNQLVYGPAERLWKKLSGQNTDLAELCLNRKLHTYHLFNMVWHYAAPNSMVPKCWMQPCIFFLLAISSHSF